MGRWAMFSRNGGAESPPWGSSAHNCRSAVYPLVSNLAMSFTSWWVMAGAMDKLVVVVNPLVRQKDVIGLTEPLMFIVVVSGECEFLVNISGARTRGYCQK